MNVLKIKRIYQPVEDSDGYRVLVDRLWPRRVKKEAAKLDEWNKDVTPSTEIRKMFNHEEEKFDEFKKLYVDELDKNAKAGEFAFKIRDILKNSNVTFLYAARNENCNHAMILQEWVEEHIK